MEENERKSHLSRHQKLEGKEESGERPGKRCGKERRREKKEDFGEETEREFIAIGADRRDVRQRYRAD
jgi:hypothetical protein